MLSYIRRALGDMTTYSPSGQMRNSCGTMLADAAKRLAFKLTCAVAMVPSNVKRVMVGTYDTEDVIDQAAE